MRAVIMAMFVVMLMQVCRVSGFRFATRDGERLLHHLQGDMGDLKLLVQLVAGRFQKRIISLVVRHDQVRGQGDLGGAHSPNVQVMYPGYAGQGCQIVTHR